MTNLIPPQAKTQLVRLYWIRLVSAWAIVWSVAFGIGLLLMYPTHLLITGTSEAYTETAASASERTEVYDEMVKELGTANLQARQIVSGAKQTKLSSILSDVWSVNGQGVEVSTVQLTRVEGELGPISLIGEAANRQALASFRNRLEALPYVASVDLPIENLALNQDIPFTITVEVNQNEL